MSERKTGHDNLEAFSKKRQVHHARTDTLRTYDLLQHRHAEVERHDAGRIRLQQRA
jgi:hypothetical protein